MRNTRHTLFVIGLLWSSVRAEITISSLKAAAVAWEGEVTCHKWDCECAFRQLGCCCASKDLQEADDQISSRLMSLSSRLSNLADNVLEDIGGLQVSFTATMSPRTSCFGPFNNNFSIPYDDVILNQGHGYNPALGVFTAPRAALYSFSFSVYSKVETGEKLSFKAQLMRDGEAVVSTWEDNREDPEDSSTQTVLLSLDQGSQVYVQLLIGRRLCGDGAGLNSFSGSLIYPLHSKNY
ncbi:cerebellin 18 isoform X2 [Cynoglossus semilaevis]|nr:cerebellin-1-like isoform X2 [Cynoglossus semilaevis]